MFIQTVPKEEIVTLVTQAVKNAKQEILVTMLMSEEIAQPLPKSYRNLLKEKVKKGIVLQRLGFGSEEEYNSVKTLYPIVSGKYTFRYLKNISEYQRLIVIDKKQLVFGVDGIFMRSEYQPLILVFIDYFFKHFRKAI